MNETLTNILYLLFGLVLAAVIIKYPYLGVVFTVSSLSIIDLLPSIGMFDTVLPLIGGVSFVGFVLQLKKNEKTAKKSINFVFIFAVLFIMWMYISNPLAAWGGNGRNWIFTFFQLFILMILSSALLNSQEKQHTLMWVFSFVAIISAFYAIQSGNIGETDNLSINASGFTDNANAAARMFTVAMVFLSYLRAQKNTPIINVLITVGIVVTYVGVFFTASRTGMVLLFVSQALLFLVQSSGKQRIRLIIVSIFGIVFLWFFAANAFVLAQTILPSVTQGSDTMGLRYSLWEAGWRMFIDKPFTGVGIGNYIGLLPFYGADLPFLANRISWAHNTYIQVLSETGLVGFVLFMGMFIVSFWNFLKPKVTSEESGLSLRKIWLITFIVMLLGGLTKSDHADKLTWAIMGLSVYFANQSESPDKILPAEKKRKIKHLRIRKVSSV